MVHYHRILIALMVVLLLGTIVPTAVSASTHEVGILNTGIDPLGKKASVWCRLGQRLTIPDRYVTEIGYCIWRVGNPTGDIILAVHNATTDEPIVTKVWGDASELGVWPEDSGKFTKVMLDEPVRINGDVRLFVEFNGGNATDYCWVGYVSGNRTDGVYTNYYHYGQWHDIGEAEEGAYFYAWVDPEDVKLDAAMPLWVIAPIGIATGVLSLYINKRQHKKHETD